MTSASNHTGLALFDFDGTLTRDDSFRHFLFHAVGVPKALLTGILFSPILGGHALGIIPNWWAKQKLFSFLFAGWSAERFEQVATAFSQRVLPGLIKPTALKRLLWHRQQGHRLFLVSASLEPYLRGWCELQGLELLGTRVEYADGRVTGRFATPNCYGPEKVKRIRAAVDPAAFQTVYAYGDSAGDREMLDLAQEKYFRSFP